MAISTFLKKLFIENDSNETKNLTLDEIRKRIFETSRNMEMRNREAAAAELKAQAALQKTFQPGVSAAQRTKLLAEHQRCLKEAKNYISFANQLGSVLETLETVETFKELSETIFQSNIAGAGKMDIKEIMRELQEAQAMLGPMVKECQKLKHALDVSAEQFDDMLSQGVSEGQDELMALYAKYDAEQDPVKKAAIQAEIQQKSEAMLAATAG